MSKDTHIYIHKKAKIKDAGAFEENKHPRASNGQFGSGGSGSAEEAKNIAAGMEKSDEQTRKQLKSGSKVKVLGYGVGTLHGYDKHGRADVSIPGKGRFFYHPEKIKAHQE